MLDDAIDLEINPNFIRITVGPPLIELKQSLINDLSTDQYYGYMIVNAIRSGVVPDRLANLQIGPVTQNVEVYKPNWVNIKVKHSWIDDPRHVLFQLELLRNQDKEVMQIVMHVVRRSAWYAHSEAIIQTLICSDKEEERKVGIEKILETRGNADENVQMRDMSLSQRVTPKINPDASSLLELIYWDFEMYESPLNCSLTTAQVKQFLHTPMIVPDWPLHIQSIERCVKMVTEASEHVYSQERRDEYIRSQIIKKLIPFKKRVNKVYDDSYKTFYMQLHSHSLCAYQFLRKCGLTPPHPKTLNK
ncbi:hypothetical protein HELRODRAFT_169148 [Helobdella robusta]|uniref:THAP9-like helix-turn-helix domain-containing protein n=1 Tax=Helobdella robusta TaxID=6412 RepID=T1F1H0_HELRO|nr:hypothetical protein HELRODRAFT_169148 [Helobdella robusta]ESO08337.1 hypothetical protein HELRODRAFT_169148 [Helobdella robusta]